MYRDKNLNDDLFIICKSQYVKMKLLQDFAYKRISQQEFVSQLSLQKDIDEINDVLKAVHKVKQKAQQNGGAIDENPVWLSKDLRSAGKLQEAYNIIVPYIEQNKDDENAKTTFGWIMYDYLKASENDLATYETNLKKFNDFVQFDFSLNNSKYVNVLLNSILFSIRKVVLQGELSANRIFEQFKRFVGNSPKFIFNTFVTENNLCPSRLLIKDIIEKLNINNYFAFIDMIGFDWFDNVDYINLSYTDKKLEIRTKPPFAEKMLVYHAKKLIQSDEKFATKERISTFLVTLTNTIKNHPEYEWLPYHRIKLLIKLGDKEQAFLEVTEFARNRSSNFWVWGLTSDLVDGDERFNCLCAGLLCKTKPEMIVGLQEKSIAYLLERGMYGEAKHILDKLIETRTNNGWQISTELQSMKNSTWYVDSKAVPKIDHLQSFADEAKKILYRTVPFTDVLITYINEKNGVINFNFMADNIMQEGYFYKDYTSKDFLFKINTPMKFRMIADRNRDNLFRVFEVAKGDEKSASNFVKEFIGTFEKVRDFGFIRDSVDDIFINPIMVKENNLQAFAKVSGKIIKKWDNKKKKWIWQIISIDIVEKASVSDFEKEIFDELEITVEGFGFIDNCYVPKDLINSLKIREYDYVRAKAQKSWDKRKRHWSWKVSEIISTIPNMH